MKKFVKLIGILSCAALFISCNVAETQYVKETISSQTTNSETEKSIEETSEITTESADDNLSSAKLPETGVLYWTSLNADYTDVKCKTLTENDTFVEDFVSGHGLEAEVVTELMSVNGNRIVNYHLADGNDIYVVYEENRDSSIRATCVYVDWSYASVSEDENYEITLDGCFPEDGDENYDWEYIEKDDVIILEYQDNQELYIDYGAKFYDHEGRILYWDHYITSGCKTLYYVWDNDDISMMIDIGGIPYGPDGDNEEIAIGEVVYIYKFL